MILALVAGAVVVLGGDTKKEAAPERDTSTTLELLIGDPVVASVSPFARPIDVPADISGIVVDLVEDYANEATVVPLRKGVAKDAALAKIFDNPALAKLAAGDRALLVDEGLPKAVGKVTVTAPAIGFTALMGDGGTVVLANAAIDFTITAEAKRGDVTIRRTGSLVLSPQLDSTWKITGWTLHVERSGRGVQATPIESTDLPTTTVAP